MTRRPRRARTLALTGAVLAAALGVTLAPEAPAATPAMPPETTPSATTPPSTLPPGPTPPGAFSFAAGGDMGYNPTAAATVKGIAAAGVDFALHLGDMAY